MLEKYCCEPLRDMCRSIVDKNEPPRIKLKSDNSAFPENPYKNYMGDYRYLWMRSVYDYGKGRRCKRYDMARRFFDDESWVLSCLFLGEMYCGSIQNAMNNTQNFEELLNNFLDWFDKKRRDFRMSFDITESKKQILENGKRPNSHGGVANLLKTLTKTMEKQGASIESIAKVQYTVCLQAGIYIPDEFIEDVAVALYTENEKKK